MGETYAGDGALKHGGPDPARHQGNGPYQVQVQPCGPQETEPDALVDEHRDRACHQQVPRRVHRRSRQSAPPERREPDRGQSRLIAAALVANAVVIGLAAVAAIAVLVVALLG